MDCNRIRSILIKDGTYVFETPSPIRRLSSLWYCSLVFFGAAVGVVGVDAVVERPTRLLFLGARAFFCR